MINVMWPGRTPAGQVPAVAALPYGDGGSAIVKGSVVIFSSGLLIISGADPAAATVVGVALQDYDTNPGFAAANSPVTTTGRSRTLSIARADATTEFVAKITNGSSTRVAPVAADLGSIFGITLYSGIWTVDRNKTTTSARVIVTAINTTDNFVYFRWLPSFINGAG